MNGLRLPTALQARQIAPQQADFIGVLYRAKEAVVSVEALASRMDCDEERVPRIAYSARRAIQGSGWQIKSHHGRGYSLQWIAGHGYDEAPDIEFLMLEMTNEMRRFRADIDMMMDAVRQSFGVPGELLFSFSADQDERIIATAGITGKLKAIAEELGLPSDLVIKRYKNLNGGQNGN